jgi:hypothetical protein
MSYVGNTNTTQAFTPAIDYFSGNGSTVAFTLSRPVASVAQVQVNVNNVAQNPSTAFTVLNNTITFTGAPSSGTNNIYVQYTSPITQVIQPGQGTVGTVQLADASVTTAKLSSTTGTGAVALASLPAFTTTIGVGGATPSASGSGITFPATQNASSDANTLDDYEEGTWTPTYTGSTTNPTCVYVVRAGSYVKVGRMVALSVRINVSSASGGVGNLNISGLPFTVDAGNGNSWSGAVGWNSQGSFLNNHNLTTIEAAGGGNFLYCHYNSSTGATFDVAASDLTTNTSIEASIVYMASA